MAAIAIGHVDVASGKMLNGNNELRDLKPLIDPFTPNGRVKWQAATGHAILLEFDAGRVERDGTGGGVAHTTLGSKDYFLLYNEDLIVKLKVAPPIGYRATLLPGNVDAATVDIEGAGGRPKIIVNSFCVDRFIEASERREITSCQETIEAFRAYLLGGGDPLDYDDKERLLGCVEEVYALDKSLSECRMRIREMVGAQD